MQDLEAADDPQATFAKLPPAAQQAIISDLTVRSIERVSKIVYLSTAASGQTCATHWERAVAKGRRNGLKLYTYDSYTTWCWDGTQITKDPYFRVSGRALAPFWYFAGTLEKTESGGQGDWMHEDYAQGHFKFCIPGELACFLQTYPELWKYQYGDGSSSGTVDET